MRIAQLVETLDAGGAEGLAVSIANALANRGHTSYLIAIQGGGRFENRIDPKVNYIDLARPREMGSSFARLTYFRRTYLVLSEILRAENIRVVQTHLPKANYFGLFLGRNQLVKIHPTVHNNREFEYGDSANQLKQFLRRRAYRQMLSWCDKMIAVSSQVKAGIAAELGVSETSAADHIVSVPNGVAIPSNHFHANRFVHRQEWGLDEKTLLIVGVGRLTRQKNFALLIEALAQFSEACPPWKCVIAGEGEQKHELQHLINTLDLTERVTLAGHVAKIQHLLAASDVFCLSSLFEGLPLVMLEAMAAKTAICATRIAGVSDVVTDGQDAVLAQSEDSGSLAQSLEALLKDKGMRKNIAAAGYDLVSKKYSFEGMIDRLEEVYRSK